MYMIKHSIQDGSYSTDVDVRGGLEAPLLESHELGNGMTMLRVRQLPIAS
jgi:hypothetical protein